MKAIISLVIVSTLCLSSCLEDENEGPDLEEFDYLLEEHGVLKEDLQKAYLELDEFDVLSEEWKGKIQAAEEKLKEMEELRKLKEETDEKMRELRQEFEDYQKKYEAKVRQEAFGEKIASIQVAGRTLALVEITAVTETEVKIRHESGFATLNHETAPPEWKARFFLRSKEEVAERAKALALFLNPPLMTEESKNKRISKRPVSDYELRRDDRMQQQKDLKGLQSKVENAFVFISGNGTEGTGFFVQDGITTFLYTAAHLLDGKSNLKITDVSGREWKKFGDLEVARGSDLVRLAVDEPVEHFLTLPKAGEAPELGIALASLGLVKGGQEVSQQVGKLRKINSTSYESSSTLIKSGGSGWPVMNTSGEVLAILTDAIPVRKDAWKTRVSSRSTRFVCRIDTQITWEKTSLGRFVGARQAIYDFDKVTRLLSSLAGLSPSSSGVNLDKPAGGEQTVMAVLQENRQAGLVKQIVALNKDLTQKKMRVSDRDLKRRVRSIYATAQVNGDKQSLNSSLFSSYHANEIEASLRFRSVARKELADAIKSLSK